MIVNVGAKAMLALVCVAAQLGRDDNAHFDDEPKAPDAVNDWVGSDRHSDACGFVIQDESSVWDTNGHAHFSLHIQVRDFEAFEDVTVSWPDAHLVKVTEAYGAELVAHTPSSVTLELGVDELQTEEGGGEHAGFGLLGWGSDSLTPAITCKWLDEPPPSPPHPADCSLHPSYSVTRAWAQPKEGELAEVRFERWDAGRVVTLTYWAQHIDVGSVQGALLYDHYAHGEDTVVQLELLGDGAEIHERLGNAVTLELSPVARRLPHIVCHSAWSPPPPAPAPSPPQHPPSPPPSPPVPNVAAAGAECSLGGTASATADRGGQTAQVLVAPRSWREGAVFEVSLHAAGQHVTVSAAANALYIGSRERGGGTEVHTFQLSAQPPGAAPAFSFTAHADADADVQVVGLSCRVAADSGGGSEAGPYTYGEAPEEPADIGGVRLSPADSEEVVVGEQDSEATGHVGFVAVVLMVLLATGGVGFYCQSNKGLLARRGLTRACRCGRAPAKISQQDDSAILEGLASGQMDKKRRWKVSVEAGGEEPRTITVPMSAASTPDELKQAIAEACAEQLGEAGGVPEAWLDSGGSALETMAVQFLHPGDGSATTLKESTAFDLLHKSRTLRVTERRAKPESRRQGAGPLRFEEM